VEEDTTVCNIANYIPFRDTLPDACGYDSVIVDYVPVLLHGPFDSVRKADTIFVGESVVLHSNGNGTVIWDSHSTLSCTSCPDPVATPTVTTVYRATNALPNGCEVSDDFTVVVLNDALVWVPTAFTPNGDGRNDYYGPIGKVPDGYKLQVFNRNGEIVFQSATMYDRWDGRYKGKVQPVGVYIYMIYYKDMQNKQHQQKGTLTLIR
jgi:gliding motility-associated-like protein